MTKPEDSYLNIILKRRQENVILCGGDLHSETHVLEHKVKPYIAKYKMQILSMSGNCLYYSNRCCNLIHHTHFGFGQQDCFKFVYLTWNFKVFLYNLLCSSIYEGQNKFVASIFFCKVLFLLYRLYSQKHQSCTIKFFIFQYCNKQAGNIKVT